MFWKRLRNSSVVAEGSAHSFPSSVKSHATRMAISLLRLSDKPSSAASTTSAKSVANFTALATKASTSEEAMAGSAVLRCKPTCRMADVRSVRAAKVAFEGDDGIGISSASMPLVFEPT